VSGCSTPLNCTSIVPCTDTTYCSSL